MKKIVLTLMCVSVASLSAFAGNGSCGGGSCEGKGKDKKEQKSN